MVLMGFRGCPLTDVRRKRSNDDMLMLERWTRDQENYCSFKETWFNSLHPHQAVTPFPGGATPSSGHHGHCMHAAHIHTSRHSHTHTHKYCKRLNVVEQRWGGADLVYSRPCKVSEVHPGQNQQIWASVFSLPSSLLSPLPLSLFPPLFSSSFLSFPRFEEKSFLSFMKGIFELK